MNGNILSTATPLDYISAVSLIFVFWVIAILFKEYTRRKFYSGCFGSLVFSLWLMRQLLTRLAGDGQIPTLQDPENSLFVALLRSDLINFGLTVGLVLAIVWFGIDLGHRNRQLAAHRLEVASLRADKKERFQKLVEDYYTAGYNDAMAEKANKFQTGYINGNDKGSGSGPESAENLR